MAEVYALPKEVPPESDSSGAMKRFWVLMVICSCGRSEPGLTQVDYRRVKPLIATAGGIAVAKFGNESVTDAELIQRFGEMNPYARARYQTTESRREYLDGLVRFELLSQEAIRQGLASDPEVVETAKRVMVQRLLKQELEDRLAPITNEQVAAYYESHKGDYVKPVMTRLSHISFSKDHRALASQTLQDVLALSPNDFAAFAKLARERSEEPRTKPLDGDMRYLSDDEMTAQYGAEVTEAAAALVQQGSVVPRLVETASGLHILKLQGRQIALNLALEQAKPSIQQVLLTAAKQEQFKKLVERLKAQSHLEVNEAVLAAMKLDVKAPAVESKTPQPGFLANPSP